MTAAKEIICIECGEPALAKCKTAAGRREVAISKLCEPCFFASLPDPDAPEQEPEPENDRSALGFEKAIPAIQIRLLENDGLHTSYRESEQKREVELSPEKQDVEAIVIIEQRENRHSYELLRKHLDESVADQFKWKRETAGIQSYTHVETGKYIHIDSTGQFYDRLANPISREIALNHALPQGHAHLHDSYGFSL